MIGMVCPTDTVTAVRTKPQLHLYLGHRKPSGSSMRTSDGHEARTRVAGYLLLVDQEATVAVRAYVYEQYRH